MAKIRILGSEERSHNREDRLTREALTEDLTGLRTGDVIDIQWRDDENGESEPLQPGAWKEPRPYTIGGYVTADERPALLLIPCYHGRSPVNLKEVSTFMNISPARLQQLGLRSKEIQATQRALRISNTNEQNLKTTIQMILAHPKHYANDTIWGEVANLIIKRRET